MQARGKILLIERCFNGLVQNATHNGCASSTEVTSLVDQVESVLEVAQALLAAGRAIDIAGLDQRIGLICARALELPAADGRGVRQRLILLQAMLAKTEAAMSP